MSGKRNAVQLAAIIGAVLDSVTLFIQPQLMFEMYTLDPSGLDVVQLIRLLKK